MRTVDKEMPALARAWEALSIVDLVAGPLARSLLRSLCRHGVRSAAIIRARLGVRCAPCHSRRGVALL